MLLVLHVQIRHPSKDLACHPGLVLPLKIVVVQVTPPAIFLIAVAFQRSAITTHSFLAPDIATIGDSVQGSPLLLNEWESPQGVPPLPCEWDSLQGGPFLRSEWDSPQGVPPLHSEWDSLQGGTLLQSEWDSPQGGPPLQCEWESPQGVPPLQCEWDSLQGGPLLQSEWDSLQGIPPLHSDSVSLQGTLLHLDISTHPVLRLVMTLLRDPLRGLLLPVHLPLPKTIRKLMNPLCQPRLRL